MAMKKRLKMPCGVRYLVSGYDWSFQYQVDTALVVDDPVHRKRS